MCGEIIECYEEYVTCDGRPVCQEGTYEVESCPEDEDGECWSETMCGATIYCMDEES